MSCRTSRSAAVVILVAAGAHGCRATPGQPATPPQPAEPRMPPYAQVPALPPTTGIPAAIAAEIYEPGNIVAGDSIITGPFPRDVVWVWFREDASADARRAAIAGVRGVVIGGRRVDAGGVYYVRLGPRGRALGVGEAITMLRKQPYVVLATPDMSRSLVPAGAR